MDAPPTDATRVIAELMGPGLLVLGIGVFLNRAAMAEWMAVLGRTQPVVFLAGIVFFVAGLAVVRSHDVWSGWPALVTVVGWLFVLGGLTRVLFPRLIADWAVAFARNTTLVALTGLGYVIVGGFLSWRVYG